MHGGIVEIMPDSMTQILMSGPPGTNEILLCLETALEMLIKQHITTKLRSFLLDGVFGHDYFYEDMQGFNIYRVNLISSQSGVSQRRI